MNSLSSALSEAVCGVVVVTWAHACLAAYPFACVVVQRGKRDMTIRIWVLSASPKTGGRLSVEARGLCVVC